MKLKGRLCQGSSSIKGCLLSKVIFRQRSSSVKGHLLSKVIFCQTSFEVIFLFRVSHTDSGMGGGTVPPIGGTICKEENCAKCPRTLELGGGGREFDGGDSRFS